MSRQITVESCSQCEKCSLAHWTKSNEIHPDCPLEKKLSREEAAEIIDRNALHISDKETQIILDKLGFKEKKEAR